MFSARRYPLAFTPKQAVYAEEIGDACRATWNTALEQRREYRRRGKYINYPAQCEQLAEARRDPYCDWLAAAPSNALQQTLRDLDQACRTHGTWKVHWRSKTRTDPSFRFPDSRWLRVRRINKRWGEVKLPRFGPVRFRWTRPIGGSIRNATVRRDAGRWYISFCIEDGITEPTPNGHGAVGVDRGVTVAVVTSDGWLRNRAAVSAGEEERIRRLQQTLARQSKRSNRRKSAHHQFAVMHARIRSRRLDFVTWTAQRLAVGYGIVAIEDLKIRSMTASARGTREKPGRNVRAKAGLNRAIHGKGWGLFRRRLEYAARYHGATVIKVPPAYTSQTCYACKHVAAESRESQAVFRCVACGHQDHADVNAAKNIRERGIELVSAAGLAVAGRGDLGNSRSTKRQPPVAI